MECGLQVSGGYAGKAALQEQFDLLVASPLDSEYLLKFNPIFQ